MSEPLESMPIVTIIKAYKLASQSSLDQANSKRTDYTKMTTGNMLENEISILQFDFANSLLDTMIKDIEKRGINK